MLHAIDGKRGTSSQLQEYSGHSDPVRGLSLRADEQGFWSCGNDGWVMLPMSLVPSGRKGACDGMTADIHEPDV